jgi:hypothetical protein
MQRLLRGAAGVGQRLSRGVAGSAVGLLRGTAGVDQRLPRGASVADPDPNLDPDGSVGSICFWSKVWIRRKISKKNLDSYCFVSSFDFFDFEK